MIATETASVPADSIVVPAGDLRSLLVGGDADPMAGDCSAVLGEPRVAAVLRRLHETRGARQLVLRVRADIDPDAITRGLRRWCEARIERNQSMLAGTRRTGWRALAACLVLLSLALLAGSLLESDALGEPSLIRRTLAEGAMIAGWVFLWRPVEMLMFDGLPQREESRLLGRLLRLEWVIEYEDATPVQPA